MKLTNVTLLALAISSAIAHNAHAQQQGNSNEQADKQQKEIEKIEVTGRRNQALTEVTPHTEKLLKIAGIDNDPLNAVYSMPGIVYAGGDDGGEPAIRGSSPDDNAFYIDNLPVGYIFHLFGDSIFNKNIVRDFSLEPAAFDSQYGNATGGIFDVQLRDPRHQDISTTIDASLIKTGILVEGGTFEDQAFYASYRRSNIHLFLDEGEEDEGYTIFKAPISDDYQAKYQWLIGDNHKLTATFTGASDTGGLNISKTSETGRIDPDMVGDLRLDTKFNAQSVNWQYFASDNQFLQLTLGNNSGEQTESFGSGQFIKVKEKLSHARLAYHWNWHPDHKLQAGIDWEKQDVDYSYDIIPYYCTDHQQDCRSQKGERIQDVDTLLQQTTAFYITEQWKFHPDFRADIGFRAERNDYTDQSFIHPRLALHWYSTEDLSFSLKYGSYSRFPDVDTALKKVGNPNIKSPEAIHYSFKTEYQYSDLWKTSIDLYYKDMSELARALDDAPTNDLRYTNDMSGSAKGVEWVIERELANDWYGWASISWSKSDRTDEITNVTQEYYLDTPLLANLVVNYQINERWDVGARLTIRSGQKYTPIIGLRDNPNHDNHFLPVYGDLNTKTLPTYVRLDLQANYKTNYWGQNVEWNFAILNATNSENISGYYYDPQDGDTLTKYSIEGEEGLEMFPSIGFTIDF